MDTERHRNFAAWVEKFDNRHIPGVLTIMDPPPYVPPTIHERVEPFATQYDEKKWELPDDEPDERFYQPTPLLIELQDRLDALRKKGFREIPNPNYDPVRAEAYWEKQRSRFNQTRIEVGQSYHP